MPDVDMRGGAGWGDSENPVCVASGTFGFGREYGAFYDLGELGAICAKGLTLHRREGNRAPESQRLPWAFSTRWASRTRGGRLCGDGAPLLAAV